MNTVKDALTGKEKMQIEIIKHNIQNAKNVKEIKKLEKQANEIIDLAEARISVSNPISSLVRKKPIRNRIIPIDLFRNRVVGR